MDLGLTKILAPVSGGITRFFRLLSLSSLAVLAVFAVAVIVGWIFEIEWLKHPLTRSPVHASVALALLFSSAALFMVQQRKKIVVRAGQVLAVVVAVSGVATCVESLSGLDWGLNYIWWQPNPQTSGLTFPGPMAPNVGMIFLLVGTSILTFGYAPRQGQYPYQYLALGATILSLLSLIGHASGAGYLCTLVGCIKMPLPVSIASMMLCCSILFAQPERGLTEILVRESNGGRLVRRFCGFLLFLLLFLSLKTAGEHAEYYDAALGWTIFALVAISGTLACIFWNAKSIDTMDTQLSSVEMRLKEMSASAELRQSFRRKFKTICLTCSKDFSHDQTICPHDGTELSRIADDPLLGNVIADRYEVISLLGSGGMSSVYKARHLGLDKIVAVKLMHSHLASNATTVKRFHVEAKAASMLSHRNLISGTDFGFTPEGEPYMVMDFVEGTPLNQMLDDERLPIRRVLDISIQICEGLIYAHEQGVIHRDLKPSNIMISTTADGKDLARIVDFGLAKGLALEHSSKLTQTGEVFGSPHYMSPEQCLGKPMDFRADIYSLGCMLYECLAGMPPFCAETPIETIRCHLVDKPEPFMTVLEVPDWLEAIVFKTLEKKLSLRHQSARELRDALVRGLAKLPDPADAVHIERT